MTAYRAMFERVPSVDGTALYIIRVPDLHTAERMTSDGQWVKYEEYAQIPPTLVLKREPYEALVRAVLTDKYGALPHDQLLRDRLDIETRRVDLLLEKLT